MALPERELVEQHVIQHAVERRFVCDICNAALKRKDHLTRHKLSHIPDRPHACNVSFVKFILEKLICVKIQKKLINNYFEFVSPPDLHEDVQTQGAADTALRDSQRREEARVQ